MGFAALVPRYCPVKNNIFFFVPVTSWVNRIIMINLYVRDVTALLGGSGDEGGPGDNRFVTSEKFFKYGNG